MKKTITFISDTHTKHRYCENDLPGGDLLIHAGDFMTSGYSVTEATQFFEWFDSNDYTFNEWEKIQIENQYIRLKKELMFYEEKGIKTKILSWENDIVNYLKNDDFSGNRFIDLNYNGVTYSSIKDLQENNKNMVIKTDFDSFGDIPPLDHHPSKLCHQVIAENIIKNIEKDLI